MGGKFSDKNNLDSQNCQPESGMKTSNNAGNSRRPFYTKFLENLPVAKEEPVAVVRRERLPKKQLEGIVNTLKSNAGGMEKQAWEGLAPHICQFHIEDALEIVAAAMNACDRKMQINAFDLSVQPQFEPFIKQLALSGLESENPARAWSVFEPKLDRMDPADAKEIFTMAVKHSNGSVRRLAFRTASTYPLKFQLGLILSNLESKNGIEDEGWEAARANWKNWAQDDAAKIVKAAVGSPLATIQIKAMLAILDLKFELRLAPMEEAMENIGPNAHHHDTLASIFNKNFHPTQQTQIASMMAQKEKPASSNKSFSTTESLIKIMESDNNIYLVNTVFQAENRHAQDRMLAHFGKFALNFQLMVLKAGLHSSFMDIFSRSASLINDIPPEFHADCCLLAKRNQPGRNGGHMIFTKE